MSQNSLDTQFLSKAIQLAKLGLYTTQPNPRVGCVIVLDEKIVGEGYHQQAGGPHAEIYALKQAGKKAQDATAYVSLEPCSHTGKTPPCADALINAGVSRVVCAMQDPNPLVAGEGLKKLQLAGIETQAGLLQTEAEALNSGFIKRMKTGLPYVRVKLAMSVDGRTAMASGESKWITGEQARADVQKYRARSSVVLTGSGTVLADNPSMNVRVSGEDLGVSVDVHQPIRAIIDSQLKVPCSSKIFEGIGQVLVFSTKKAEHIITVPEQSGKVDLTACLKILAAEHQANEVHVEAGSELCGALLAQQLVDEIIIYMAPHIMGDSAKGLFHLPDLNEMSARLDLEIKEIRPIGKDWRITVHPKY
ncbi:Diaminohydroxyphosphoribosylaminopyrimidine deaminase / 5-amino-6-(5-phosphoribosylamino)uracil reductase [hydrothermal vent metagenome]|uniref:Diaminohydroxyphosphoribosylaminopyrimidine deaminase / 5-amino-6-(5-phosphoribosylamino)uracil reductase n=1 Tax=hydrothermal vent metagenome TaxID=652676 RepID=A0A3B0WPL6_9ZZZZ